MLLANISGGNFWISSTFVNTFLILTIILTVLVVIWFIASLIQFKDKSKIPGLLLEFAIYILVIVVLWLVYDQMKEVIR